MDLRDGITVEEIKKCAKHAWDMWDDEPRTAMINEAHLMIEIIGLNEFICMVKTSADLSISKEEETRDLLEKVIENLTDSSTVTRENADDRVRGISIVVDAIEKAVSDITGEAASTVILTSEKEA